MALSRVKTWISGEVLTHTDLNAEFDNLLNNALSLISPLTGNLAFGGYRATGLSLGSVSDPSVQFTGDTNSGVYSSGPDTVDIAAGAVRAASFATAASGVNYFLFTPSATTAAISLDAAGSDTNIGINIDTKGTGAHVFRTAGGSTERMRMTGDGRFLIGTTTTAGSSSGDICLANNTNVNFLNAAGTSGYGMRGDSSNNLSFSTRNSKFVFNDNASGALINLLFENSGGGIHIVDESSAAHTAPASGVIIYAIDNGAGKTQLMAIFPTGAAQQLAIQP